MTYLCYKVKFKGQDLGHYPLIIAKMFPVRAKCFHFLLLRHIYVILLQKYTTTPSSECNPLKEILTYVMSITQCQPSVQPCITALDNWRSPEETSSCTYWQSSWLFLFKLLVCLHWSASCCLSVMCWSHGMCLVLTCQILDNHLTRLPSNCKASTKHLSTAWHLLVHWLSDTLYCLASDCQVFGK